MSKHNYICRDCQQTRWVRSVEVDRGTFYSGRIKCFNCGGTMDPIKKEKHARKRNRPTGTMDTGTMDEWPYKLYLEN